MIKEELLNAKEWFVRVSRGKTICEGHPITIIDSLIDNALAETPDADRQVDLDYLKLKFNEIITKEWSKSNTLGDAVETTMNKLINHLHATGRLATIPKDWPTPEMLVAGDNYARTHSPKAGIWWLRGAFKAMLSAAPKPTGD